MSSPSRTSHHEEDGSRTPVREESGSQTPQRNILTPAQQIESETTTPRRQGMSGRRTPAHRHVHDYVSYCRHIYLTKQLTPAGSRHFCVKNIPGSL
jgi:hypothetical protein